MSNNHSHSNTIGSSPDRIIVRAASADDGATLRRLAELDSAAGLRMPALIGEVDGIPVAARSIAEGDTIANPFVPTQAIVELLEARARSLSSGGLGRIQRGWRTTGLRAAPASSSRRTGVV